MNIVIALIMPIFGGAAERLGMKLEYCKRYANGVVVKL